jgi:hypothetical protein
LSWGEFRKPSIAAGTDADLRAPINSLANFPTKTAFYTISACGYTVTCEKITTIA